MSSYASKTNLAALKTEVDKIDTDKLKTVPNDLAKLRNVVKNDVVKKTDYNTLKSKVDSIDVSKYVGRTKYETDEKAIYNKIDAVEKKIPVLTAFVTSAHFNHEKNLLATKTALTIVENKILDVSSYASKTNLAALKTEVDKIDTVKLKAVPNDLAKLSNVVKNDAVKKTDYNTLKSKVDSIDVSKYVGRTKYETDGKAIYDQIDAVEKKIPVLTDFVTTAGFNHEKHLLATKTALATVENKIPDIINLATKTSLSSLLPVNTFNSKVTELEGKVTPADNKFSGYAKKTDVASDITKIKNDYDTNASLDSKLNYLKAQHIATEVKTIHNKVKKNASDI